MSIEDNEEIKISIPEEFKVPKYVNTYRIGFTEDEFIIDFGNRIPETNEVSVNSRVSMPVEKMKNLILACFEAGKRFEKEYKKNIGGFSLGDGEEDE